MHISIAVVPVVLTIHFTEKLPHGPYVETVTQTSYNVYVPPSATVHDATEALCDMGREAIETQSKNLPIPGKMTGKFSVKQVKCKGGKVTDDTVLNTILSDGESLQINLKQTTMTCCILS
jgi:hypothetical protein